MQVGYEELDIIIIIHAFTRRALSRAHVSPTKVFRQLAVNKTILKPRLAAATGGQYVYVRFSRHNKIPRCSVYMTSGKAIRFRHPDYKPDRAQKLISSSMCRHLSCRNATFHPNPCTFFLVILLTDRQTNTGKNIYLTIDEVNNAHTFSDDTESVTRWAAW